MAYYNGIMMKHTEKNPKDRVCVALNNPLPECDTLQPVSIVFDHYGIKKCLPGQCEGPRTRSDFVIRFILSGKGHLRSHMSRFDVEENHMFLLFPGKEHTCMADAVDPWQYCWISFRGDGAEPLMRSIGFSENCPVLALRNCAGIGEEIRSLLTFRQTAPQDYFRKASRLNSIFALITDQTDDSAAVSLSRNMGDLPYASIAIRFIQTHYNKKLYISELASSIGISRNYLTQLVKEQIGLSPQEYLIHYRLEHAAHALRNSADSISLVAMECGYDDPLAFSKAFKKKYGVSPSVYRKEKKCCEIR